LAERIRDIAGSPVLAQSINLVKGDPESKLLVISY